MRKIPACREIIRLTALGCSDKKISEITGSTRRTVKKTREKAVEVGVVWPLDYKMNDEKIYYTLFPKKTYEKKKKTPDLDQIYRELTDNPVRAELYNKYVDECLINGESPVSYSRFCRTLKQEAPKHRVTEDEKMKPGESVIVFWMEYPVELLDRKMEKAYILIGILPYSQNVYVKGYKDRGIKTWINANTEMLRCFGGVPKELIVRGTGGMILRCLNDFKYKEMMEHYGIVQTRYRDKKFDSELLETECWFQDKLDDKKFDTLAHLNEALAQYRNEFLDAFVRGKKTRDMIFVQDERPFLRELPEDTYYTHIRKPAKIQRNSHISYEKRHYSVPYQFLAEGKTNVEIEVTSKDIIIYYADTIIAQHPNMRTEYEGAYSTYREHMPTDEQELLLEWNKEHFLKKADKVGKNTRRIIEAVMNTKRFRQQAYKVCDAILRLGAEYTYAKLESVCAKITYVKNGSVYMTIADELKRKSK